MYSQNLYIVFLNIISNHHHLKGEEGSGKKTPYCLENYPQKIRLCDSCP